MKLAMRSLFSAPLLLSLLVPGCGSRSDNSGSQITSSAGGQSPAATGGQGGSDAPDGSAGSQTSGGAASGSSGGGGSIGPVVPIGDGGCVGEVLAGEQIPLDIYVLFDRSGSMATPVGSGTRMDAVRSATETFLKSRASTGLRVGLGYFGYMPIGKTSCDPADYATPAVEIGLLPDHVDPLLASLDQAKPIGETPTGPAIHGACGYAKEWKKANPGREVAILLVTDGVPEAPVTSKDGSCNPTLQEAVSEATACTSGAGGLPIYVLGVGPSLDNLNQIAAAGGTERAYLVSSGDVSAEVLKALNAIRGDAVIPCEFKLPEPPEGESLDFTKVNAVFTDSANARHDLYYVESRDRCTEAGGWYYDEPGSPNRILLCPSSCEAVSVPGGRFNLALGCERIIIVH